MPETLGEIAESVRSKNAGPFWITVDIFCGDSDRFSRISSGLDSAEVASLFDTPLQTLKRFDIAELSVVKFSFPRPAPQGTIRDRDMHGASFSPLLADLKIA